MSIKPKLIVVTHNGRRLIYFFCPGCGHGHPFEVPRWSFNEDFEKPTFVPSLRVSSETQATKEKPAKSITHCHLFLKDGMIEFCADSPHELKGQTVPMIDWPENYRTPDE